MDQDASRNFKFDNFGYELEIEIDEENKAKCPKCGRKFKLLMQHIKKSSLCQQNLDYEKFRKEYDAFTNRRCQRAYWKKKLELNPIKMRKIEATRKRMERERKLKANTEEMRKNKANKIKMQRERKLKVDADGTRAHEATRKRKERERKLEANAEETRKYEAIKIRRQRERKLAVDAEGTRNYEATEKKAKRKKAKC